MQSRDNFRNKTNTVDGGDGVTDTCGVLLLACTRMPVPFLKAWGQRISHEAVGNRKTK